MNSNIFADTNIHFKNNYFNLLSFVYYNVFKYKRSNCVPNTINLKKRVIYLNLKNKRLKSIDLSNFFKLKKLNCKCNLLTSLNLEYVLQLEYLNCGYNQLTSLNLEHNPKLKKISLQDNRLTSLILEHTPPNLNFLIVSLID